MSLHIAPTILNLPFEDDLNATDPLVGGEKSPRTRSKHPASPERRTKRCTNSRQTHAVRQGPRCKL